MVAGLLLVLSVVAVAAAALSGSWLVATLCALLAAVLGVAATRITYSETVLTRIEAGADRAAQAQAYRALTDERVGENAEFVAHTQVQLAQRQTTIGRLEQRLETTAADLAEARRQLDGVSVRLETVTAERDRLARRLDDADQRAAEAIVRVAELEHEYDVVMAELQATQVPRRKHA